MDIMDFISTIAQQGVWAILFVWILIKNSNDTKSREKELTEMLKERDIILSDMKDALVLIAERLDN